MANFKSMHDLRTIRSVRTRPRGQTQSYIEMHRYAEERRRLEQELQMWTQKIERIQRRLAELDELLQTQLAQAQKELLALQPAFIATTDESKPAWSQVTLEY
ncbi:MAG: hypothetical protein HY741_07790 [Chloroflexi bacterium]|nr:hypothetical protein [Chloroflexota bacterium]